MYRQVNLPRRQARFDSRLSLTLTTLKAPKYDAKAGQVIAGNLVRGGDGKFTRGDGSAASGREVISALTKKPKAGKRGAAKVTDAQQDATAQKVGLQAGDAKALSTFAKGGKMDDATAARMEKAGMVERGANGELRFTGAGRSATRAMQKGDERAAADATSRARDAQSKREERQAKREQAAADRAARAGKRAGVTQSRDNQRAEAEAKRNVDEKAKIVNRLEEIETLATQRGDEMTPLQRTQSINRLEELAKRLDKAGGDDATAKRIEKLRRELSGEDAPDESTAPDNPTPFKERKDANSSLNSFEVFKAAGGGYRWLAITSNAYEDHDGEIVSAKALEADAERMEMSGEYGPLRWWHVGRTEYATPLDWQTAKAGKGVDIGTTDFSAVLGRMAVEGGTIQKEFAETVMASPHEWQLSRGFAHPIGEPTGGVFHNIRTFERSLLPQGRAANPFTGISIQQEIDMASMKEKLQGLADKFFGGDMTKAEAFAAEVVQKDKEIAGAGVTFKAGDAKDDVKAGEDATVDEAAVEEVKAEGDALAVDDAGDAGDNGAAFIGDMTPDEFAQLLGGAIAQALTPLMSQVNEMKNAADGVQKELHTTKEASGALITKLELRVKELEGDAPTAKGFRASQAGETVKEVATPPAPQDEFAKLAAWLVGTPAQ